MCRKNRLPRGMVRYAPAWEESLVAVFRGWRPIASLWRRGLARFVLALAVSLLPAVGVVAETEIAEGEAADVGLGRLLHLPKSYQASPPSQAPQRTANEWRARYAAADQNIRTARAELKKLQLKMEKHAGESSSWNLSAPGMGMAKPEDVPVNYSLSQEIRNQKDHLEDARRARKMLDVEADMAGVPDDWRTDPSVALRAGDPKAAER